MLIQVLLAAVISSGLVWARADEVLAIRAHTIWTVSQDSIQDGVVLVRNGKIEAVGTDLTLPDDVKVLDMPQSHVVPGLIDAHSHLGLAADPWMEMDEAVFAASADTHILDAYNPEAAGIKRAVRAGITSALIAPGNRNPIAGQTAVVKFCSGPENECLLKRDAGLKFSVTNEALLEISLYDYRTRYTGFSPRPTSRPGMLQFIREHLDRAKHHDNSSFDPQASALKRVMDREIPVFIAAETADEIGAALGIVAQYDLDARIIGARQADELAADLAGQEIPVCYSPLVTVNKDKDLKRLGKLGQAGVPLALASHAPRTASGDLRTSAILAVKYGLDKELALQSLTLQAAKLLGVDDRVGSIEQGKDADLVILSGSPLELTSSVQRVIINGKTVYQGEKQ